MRWPARWPWGVIHVTRASTDSELSAHVCCCARTTTGETPARHASSISPDDWLAAQPPTSDHVCGTLKMCCWPSMSTHVTSSSAHEAGIEREAASMEAAVASTPKRASAFAKSGTRARDATCAAPYEVSEITPAAAVADAVRVTNEAIGVALRTAMHASRTAESKAMPAPTAKSEYRTATIRPFDEIAPARCSVEPIHAMQTIARAAAMFETALAMLQPICAAALVETYDSIENTRSAWSWSSAPARSFSETSACAFFMSPITSNDSSEIASWAPAITTRKTTRPTRTKPIDDATVKTCAAEATRTTSAQTAAGMHTYRTRPASTEPATRFSCSACEIILVCAAFTSVARAFRPTATSLTSLVETNCAAARRRTVPPMADRA